MIDRHSLKFRFGLALACLTLLVWLAGAWVTLRVTEGEAEEILDGQLARISRFVASLPTEEFEEYEHAGTAQAMPRGFYEPDIAIIVWGGDGKRIFSSGEAPVLSMPVLPAGTVAGREVSTSLLINGETWCSSALRSVRTGHIVQAVARQNLGWAYMVHVANRFARAGLLVFPLTVFIAWLALNGALRHIERLRAVVAARDPQSVTQIPGGEAPTEMLGLIEAINGLATRHLEAQAEIQRFTADAAHELRTPLASILTHAQVALAERNDEWRRMSLEQIEAVAKRTSRMLDQLLKLAHLNHVDVDFTREHCDLVPMLRRIAAAEGVTELRIEARDVDILGVPSLIDMAVRNLVANARKYGRGKVLLEVGSRPAPNGTTMESWIAVEDDGPGIPKNLREKVFDPFYRVPGAAGEGSGLGLSIVNRVAALHRARIRAETGRRLGGARFVFRFASVQA